MTDLSQYTDDELRKELDKRSAKRQKDAIFEWGIWMSTDCRHSNSAPLTKLSHEGAYETIIDHMVDDLNYNFDDIFVQHLIASVAFFKSDSVLHAHAMMTAYDIDGNIVARRYE